MDDYQYFENEGAYYRSKVQVGGFVGWIDDVWTPDGWEPYKGDSAYRYTTVSRIAESQVPPFPKPKPTMTKQAAAEGGVIIFGLPPKPKTR